MSDKESFREFSTGARRATGEKLRYDLIPLAGLRRLAGAATEGASKYEVGNWLKGIPTSNLLAHAWEHLVSYSEGDRSEDHLGHLLWNVSVICHNEARRPDLHDASPSQLEEVRPDPTETELSPPIEDVVSSMAREPLRHPGVARTIEGGERLRNLPAAGNLPDGTSILPCRWHLLDPPAIEATIHGDHYLIRTDPFDEGKFLVEAQGSGPGRWTRTAKCWEIEACLESGTPVPAPALPEDTSIPSGPSSPGLVEKSYPLHPSDEGWDEWRALIERVDRSHHRPWWDKRAGWCVRMARPTDGENGVRRLVEILGKGRWSMHRAYEFAARQLDIVGNSHHPGEA